MNEIDFTDLIGKPFDPDGYGPDNYSCYGLAVEVYRRFGIDLPRTNISVCACKEASNQEIQTHIEEFWDKILRPVAPCGVVIRSMDPNFAHHIGVHIGNGRLIHITLNRSVVIDRMSTWQQHIIGYYRYVGIDRQST